MTAIIAGWIGIMGAACGSFLNVLIDRPEHNESIQGRSHCDSCNRTLHWYELIPVLSYVMQGGRCSTCKVKLSLQYPLIELASAGIFIISYWYLAHGDWLLTVVFALIGFASLGILLSDIKNMTIPDWAVVVLFICGLLLNQQHLPLGLATASFSAMLFLLVYVLSHGAAMGFGDVKLAFVMGYLLSLPSLLFALYISVLTGGLVAGYLLLTKKVGMKSTISFGPFLIVGLITMIWYEYTKTR
ncbi:MAG: prepilin peptidase [Candidatus Roizmanbacteria bacterium]|nr:prepilin peptidase [Candidatus Roizmanbacteria bacterium]